MRPVKLNLQWEEVLKKAVRGLLRRLDDHPNPESPAPLLT
jgi:hypothetical protein